MPETLWGDALADRAWGWLSQNAHQATATIDEIEKGLELQGIEIRGDHPRRVLSSGMNRSNHKLERVERAVWRARPREEWLDATEGVTGADLVDAAYAEARALDPDQRGFHYADLAGRLWDFTTAREAEKQVAVSIRKK